MIEFMFEHKFDSMFSNHCARTALHFQSGCKRNRCLIMRHHINSIMELKRKTVKDAALILTGDSLAGICSSQ